MESNPTLDVLVFEKEDFYKTQLKNYFQTRNVSPIIFFKKLSKLHQGYAYLRNKSAKIFSA